MSYKYSAQARLGLVQLNSNSQKFRDALVYTYQIDNFQISIREFFRHRAHLQ